jgi:hypothetical protein
MALSDLWTQSQLNAAVRRELMDPTGTTSWSWNDIELNQYISDWQNFLQDRFEFVWGSATYTTLGTATITSGTLTNTSYGTSTFTLTAIATNILRPGNMWWNGYRLVGRDKDELEVMERDWRAVEPGVPECVYQDDAASISVWPPPGAGTSTNTLVLEYPAILSFATNTTPMSIPPWTKYSCVNYCAMRAYVRPGPQQDLSRAARYKTKFVKQGIRFRDMWDQYLPHKAPSLRPVTDNGDHYMGDTLNIGEHNTLFQTWF